MKPANMFAPFLVVLGLLCPFIVIAPIANAQTETAISTDGVIESTEGGFKFPDGTVQTTRSTDVAAFEYVLETDSGGFAISRDLRPELDEFCGDIDGCSIRLATAWRWTTIATAETSEFNDFVQEFEFMIGRSFEGQGNIVTSYTVANSFIRLNPDVEATALRNLDGNLYVLEISHNDFSDCIFSDADPGSDGTVDNGPAMTLSAEGEVGPTIVADLICRMWIFD